MSEFQVLTGSLISIQIQNKGQYPPTVSLTKTLNVYLAFGWQAKLKIH